MRENRLPALGIVPHFDAKASSRPARGSEIWP